MPTPNRKLMPKGGYKTMWEERFLKGPRGLLNVPMHVYCNV